MDIISYGIANKAGASEKKTRDTTLAAGVQGKHPNVKSRIDSLEKAFEGLTLKANQMIVNDTINIMKANAKLNAIAKTTRYKLQNMIFDDLLDLSGIDLSKSNGYAHDAVMGLITGGTIITTPEVVDTVPKKAIFTVEEQRSGIAGNMINDAVITLNGGSMVTNTSLSDGNKDVYSWDDTYGANEGVIFTFPDTRYVSKIIFYAAPRYPVYGAKVLVDGLEVAVNPNTFNMWEILVNKNVKKIEFIRTNRSYDQTLSEVEIYGGEDEVVQLGKYSVSRDGGSTWEPIVPDTLFYFDDNISPLDKNICFKMELPSGIRLLNYALTWA